jgi:iron complex outermembrane receptor protein
MKIASAACMAVSLSIAGVAGAQTGASAGGSDTGPAAQKGSTALEEVVVTAERRSTNLQQTAIAASVLTGEDLSAKGVLTVDQLQTVMPSVAIDNFGQGNDFDIRGIGKGEHNTQTGTGVIVYRDGVATFPGYLQDEPFFDIGTIEVLRGPQGTFAGQNSTGGAVFITEADPKLSGVEGYLSAGYGNYNDIMVQGAVNTPLSDTMATRVAFYDEYRDSFWHITGPFTGGNGTLKESSFRFSLLWQPSDALRVVWKNDYSYIDSGGYPADPATAPNDLFHITANGPELAIDQFGRSVLNVDYKFGNGVELRSITGAQWGRTAYNTDLDGTSALSYIFKDAADERLLSQEFDLISPDKGFVTWVVGIYYQNNNYLFPVGRYQIGYPPALYDYTLSGTNVTDTAAAFGQLTFNLTDRLQLQIGGRYSYNDSTNHVPTMVTYPAVPLVYSLLDVQSEHDDRPTGKVSLSYKLTPNNFLYAFASTGYKPGGLNVPALIGIYPAPFRSEYVTDYEVGWKSSALDNHLRTQIGGYWNNFKNFQVSIDEPQAPTFSIEVNDPSTTKLYGVEASAQALFGDLSFDVAGAWSHSELGNFFAGDPRFGGFGVTTCDPATGPGSLGCVNLAGHPQTYAPSVTYSVGGQYVIHMGAAGSLTPRANFAFIGGQWATLFDMPLLGDYLGARRLLSSQLAWQKGDWNVTAYGTNLLDEHYVGAMNSGLRFAGPPRQFGIRLTRTF